jgi:Tol biopolymer transport system component
MPSKTILLAPDFLLTCLLALAFTWINAQGNDVYLFSMEKSGKGEYHLHSPKFISTFNPGGFSNQPAFTPSGELLLSVRKSDEKQNDIYQFNVNTRRYRRLTQTNATEYSPGIHPDEEHLTVIRREDNGDQRVCMIHLKTGEFTCLVGDMRDVGYYTWLNNEELGLFRIESGGSRLVYFNSKENKSRRITTSIGRALFSDKSGNLIYLHKFTDQYWYIKKYNPRTSEIEIVTQSIGKEEDFAIAPDGTYFMVREQVLHIFHPETQKEWVPIADLSIYGIRNISRLSISPDAKKLIIIASNTDS